LESLPRLHASFNILLDTALAEKKYDIANKFINVALEHEKVMNEIYKECDSKFINISSLGNVTYGRQGFGSLTILCAITKERFEKIGDYKLKEKCSQLVRGL
jgi:hypothetical protein